ncbi:hypothetical protein D9619_002254 [Psilocybe cf. subviscida]|uniref:Uncharacterized protein n=1 Tax=Psilocybe cf. subviscida TaxID=2480587 RepID=A0A8H5F3W6_9AGAR|nr:hypothetical protein D9619_002254 [Psilocybe cf. subviscida]
MDNLAQSNEARLPCILFVETVQRVLCSIKLGSGATSPLIRAPERLVLFNMNQTRLAKCTGLLLGPHYFALKKNTSTGLPSNALFAPLSSPPRPTRSHIRYEPMRHTRAFLVGLELGRRVNISGDDFRSTLGRGVYARADDLTRSEFDVLTPAYSSSTTRIQVPLPRLVPSSLTPLILDRKQAFQPNHLRGSLVYPPHISPQPMHEPTYITLLATLELLVLLARHPTTVVQLVVQRPPRRLGRYIYKDLPLPPLISASLLGPLDAKSGPTRGVALAVSVVHLTITPLSPEFSPGSKLVLNFFKLELHAQPICKGENTNRMWCGWRLSMVVTTKELLAAQSLVR